MILLLLILERQGKIPVDALCAEFECSTLFLIDPSIIIYYCCSFLFDIISISELSRFR